MLFFIERNYFVKCDIGNVVFEIRCCSKLFKGIGYKFDV